MAFLPWNSYQELVEDFTAIFVPISGSPEDGTVYGVIVVKPGGNVEFPAQIKVAGGSPGVDKVLTSDADGLATWETPTPDRTIQYRVLNITATAPVSPNKYDVYVDTDDNHYYKYNGATWDDLGVATNQDEVINLTDAQEDIYRFNGSTWDEQSTVADGTNIRLEDIGNNFWGFYSYSTSASSWTTFSATPGIFTDPSTGNIGIGTVVPTQVLHIRGSALLDASGTGNSSNLLVKSGSNLEAVLDLYNGTTRKWIISNYGPGNDQLTIRTGSVFATETKVLIDQSGRVGIGEILPLAKLHVKAYTDWQAYFEGLSDRPSVLYFGKESLNTVNDFVDFRFTADDLVSSIVYWRVHLDTGDMVFSTPGKIDFEIGSDAGDDFVVGTNKFIVEGDTGNVGIGTDTPTAALDLPASTIARATTRFRDGIAPTSPNAGDTWRKIVPADVYGNPSTDNLMINTTKGEYDLLASHLSGDTVFVDSLDDLPAPVAGKITFEDKTYTFRSGNFILPYTLVIPENTVVGMRGGTIIYVGGGNLFESTADIGTGGLIISESTIVDFVGTGTLFNITGSDKPNSVIRIDMSIITGFSSLGTITDLDILVLNQNYITDMGGGITIDDTNTIAFVVNGFVDWKNQSTTMINITGTIDIVNIIGNTLKPQSNESMFNFDSAATFESCIVSSNTLNLNAGGAIFAAGSKDKSDINFKYSGNTTLEDSIAQAEAYITIEAATSLVQDIPSKIAGTLADGAERFQADTTGRLTYTGLEEIFINVSANPSGIAGGANQDVSFYFSQGNDTLNTITAVTDQGGGVIRITTGNPHGLTTGDRVAQTNTTSYNDTYTITVIDATNYDITETFVATETGNWQLIVEKTKAMNTIISSTKSSATFIQSKLTFRTNDFVECFVENNTTSNSVTIKTMSIIAN